MKKCIVAGLFLILSVVACEDIYDPKLGTVEDLLVVEARIVYGNPVNEVRLHKTIRFTDPVSLYPVVSGARVTLTDDRNRVIELPEAEKGRYRLLQNLDTQRLYKLRIVHGGETYESDYEYVPGVPEIDSAYVVHAEKLLETGTDESAINLRKEPGSQLYIDIEGNRNISHFRFTGRKILQYVYTVPDPNYPGIEGTMFAWISIGLSGVFNIAGPPEYSVSDHVRKHPLVFLEKSWNIFIPDTPTYFSGWIFQCQQYALSEKSYNYYNELNSQLSAGGKLFDPLYTQARGNIRCTSDPEKVVLGNFEISTVREHRFFVRWLKQNDYYIHRIPYFWNIPSEGKVFGTPPEWWENIGREYPGQ